MGHRPPLAWGGSEEQKTGSEPHAWRHHSRGRARKVKLLPTPRPQIRICRALPAALSGGRDPDGALSTRAAPAPSASRHSRARLCIPEPPTGTGTSRDVTFSWDVTMSPSAPWPEMPGAAQPWETPALGRGQRRGGQGLIQHPSEHRREPTRPPPALLPVVIPSQFAALGNAMGIRARALQSLRSGSQPCDGRGGSHNRSPGEVLRPRGRAKFRTQQSREVDSAIPGSFSHYHLFIRGLGFFLEPSQVLFPLARYSATAPGAEQQRSVPNPISRQPIPSCASRDKPCETTPCLGCLLLAGRAHPAPGSGAFCPGELGAMNAFGFFLIVSPASEIAVCLLERRGSCRADPSAL